MCVCFFFLFLVFFGGVSGVGGGGVGGGGLARSMCRSWL